MRATESRWLFFQVSIAGPLKGSGVGASPNANQLSARDAKAVPTSPPLLPNRPFLPEIISPWIYDLAAMHSDVGITRVSLSLPSASIHCKDQPRCSIELEAVCKQHVQL